MYSSPTNVRVIKLRRMRWAGHVALSNDLFDTSRCPRHVLGWHNESVIPRTMYDYNPCVKPRIVSIILTCFII
jgi:hypothetical protein